MTLRDLSGVIGPRSLPEPTIPVTRPIVLPFFAEFHPPWRVHVEQSHGRASCGCQADNLPVPDCKVIAPHVGARMKQGHHSARFGIDAGKIWPFVGVAPVTRERESGRIVGASVLLRNYVFDMESDEGSRLLRHAAILTRIPCAFSDRFTQSLVHAKRIVWRGNGAPLPA